MIEEEAVVSHTEAGQVWVEKPRRSACGGCSQQCASAVVGQYLGTPIIRLQVFSPIDVHVGDRVMLGIQEDAIVKGSFCAYLIPLLGLFFGAVLGDIVASSLIPAISNDGASAFGGVIGLILSFVFLKSTGALSRGKLHPVVLRKLS
ncbi:SoxR reducing system RseC family protein [Methylocaldum sp.]|uniref:SoxR reducing system RseC family protein n=1 Tax=Methylocaldum sp. TaxID=1969727 RepID=UPI002D43F7F1|nr:SoxR reducing system RseC family protein [Methylocaldum sp.]HYE36537.1 SoxR reducing system RseC family protein [Methylocaldum sp.]